MSRDLQLNCITSFYFRLYLVLHAFATIFDVTGNLENRCELNKRRSILICLPNALLLVAGGV